MDDMIYSLQRKTSRSGLFGRSRALPALSGGGVVPSRRRRRDLLGSGAAAGGDPLEGAHPLPHHQHPPPTLQPHGHPIPGRKEVRFRLWCVFALIHRFRL